MSKYWFHYCTWEGPPSENWNFRTWMRVPDAYPRCGSLISIPSVLINIKKAKQQNLRICLTLSQFELVPRNGVADHNIVNCQRVYLSCVLSHKHLVNDNVKTGAIKTNYSTYTHNCIACVQWHVKKAWLWAVKKSSSMHKRKSRLLTDTQCTKCWHVKWSRNMLPCS